MLKCCFSRIALFLVAMGSLAFVGCSEQPVKGLDLAPVTGAVTLDGEPLVGAMVASIALPSATGKVPALGAPSWGLTDAEGRFTLKYRGRVSGAVIGPCEIRINKVQEDASSGGMAVPGQEMIPARYNTSTTLKETVKEGQPNEFTFELTTKPKHGRRPKR